ncbi:MAG: glycosyltransferase 87 family protein [Chloroflexota bacterium]|nr:glycosyltransferase 87 family protein [Chloroflexota bacterium]
MQTNLEQSIAAKNEPDRVRRLDRTTLAWFVLLVVTLSLYSVRQIADGPYGKDFTVFLTGASVLVEGHGGNLYDIATQTSAQHEVSGGLRFAGGLLPFNYPPYVAFLFIPLTFVSPGLAYYIWLAVQWGLLLGLALSVRANFRKWTGNAPTLQSNMLLLFCFVPVIEALLMGQMSLVLLSLWWSIFVSWRQGKWTQLGVALALAMFKPQMAVLLVAALVVQRRWRALAVALGTSILLWGGALLFCGPGVVGGYLNMLQLSSTTIGTLGFYPASMPNVRGLLTILGVSPQLSLQVAIFLWLASIAATARLWRTRYSLATCFGLTALVAVLFSPHLYIHDASLLMATVWCVQLARAEHGLEPRTGWLILPFAAMFTGIYAIVFQIASFNGLVASVLLLGLVLAVRLLRTVAGEKQQPAAEVAYMVRPGEFG